jgi:hypothetical protein
MVIIGISVDYEQGVNAKTQTESVTPKDNKMRLGVLRVRKIAYRDMVLTGNICIYISDTR